MTTKKENKSKELLNQIDNINLEIETKRKELEALEAQKSQTVEKLRPEIKVPDTNFHDEFLNNDWYNQIQFDENYGITVMNLTYWRVNIVCGKYGHTDKIYELPTFGSRAIVPYKDLVEFVFHHKNFIEEGKVAILNEDFLKKHDLLPITHKIITFDTLRAVLNGSLSADDVINLYHTASLQQQKFIVESIIERMAKDEAAYDPYFLNRLTKNMKINFVEKAEELRQYLESLNILGNEM